MNNTVGTHQFSGENYAISLAVDSNRLTVEVEHQDTTEQWRATFEKTCKYERIIMFYLRIEIKII